MPTPTPQWGDCVKDGVATLNCIPILFQNVINGALIFAGVVALFIVIFAGFKFINSGGDPKQVEGARSTLTFALAGLAVVLFSFFIVNLIAYITGAQCITLFGFGNCHS